MLRLFLIFFSLLCYCSHACADTFEDGAVDTFTTCERTKPRCLEEYVSAVRDLSMADQRGSVKEFAETVYVGGWLLRLIGEWQGAETAFLRAKGILQADMTIAQDARNAMLWHIDANLGQLYIHEKRYTSAETLLSDASQNYAKQSQDKDDARLTWALWGDALLGLHRYAEAEQAYLHAKSLIEPLAKHERPKRWEAFTGELEVLAPVALDLRFAELYRQQRKYDLALSLTQHLLKQAAPARELTGALEVAAAIHLARKEDSKAQTLLLRALTMREAEMARRCSISPLLAGKTLWVLTQLARLSRKKPAKENDYASRAMRLRGFSDRHPIASTAAMCH